MPVYIIRVSDGVWFGDIVVESTGLKPACRDAIQMAEEDGTLLDQRFEEGAEFYVDCVTHDVGTEFEATTHNVPIEFASRLTQAEYELERAEEEIAHLKAELSARRAGDC